LAISRSANRILTAKAQGQVSKGTRQRINPIDQERDVCKAENDMCDPYIRSDNKGNKTRRESKPCYHPKGHTI